MFSLTVGASEWLVVEFLALRGPVLTATSRTPGVVSAPVLAMVETLAVEAPDGLSDERPGPESLVVDVDG